MKRTILILQGPPGRFSRGLGEAFAARGCKVVTVNVCAGDLLYRPRARNYRGGKAGWAQYLENLIQSEGITDILYYADRLPYHRIAQQVAAKVGVRAISYEFGYLRPDWIIVERGGQSSYSHFPDDLSVIRAQSKDLPAPDTTLRYPYPFSHEAFNEVVFHLVNSFLWFLYPRYDADKYYWPLREYLSYLPRLWREKRAAAPAQAAVERLSAGDTPFFVVPLQKQDDYQIRCNAPYLGLHPFIRDVIASFARAAPAGAELVFKLHPLDSGIENFRKTIRVAAKDAGISDRVTFIDGGDLGRLMRSTAGVVTVNSTVGLHALQAHAPAKCMGIAVFDIDGLTHQGPLDAFWTEAKAPAAEDVQALVRLLADAVHVKGNFYTADGRTAAITGFVDRVLDDRINTGAYVDPAPRLDRARAMGIEVD